MAATLYEEYGMGSLLEVVAVIGGVAAVLFVVVLLADLCEKWWGDGS